MVPNLPWIEEVLMVRSRPADLVSCARNAEEKRLLHPLDPVLAISVKSRRVISSELRIGSKRTLASDLELRSSLRNFESQNEYGYKPCIKRRFQNAETLQFSHWVTTAQARMPEQQRNELEELKRLRLQVRQQQAEIDFLKKAAAYFAKLPK